MLYIAYDAKAKRSMETEVDTFSLAIDNQVSLHLLTPTIDSAKKMWGLFFFIRCHITMVVHAGIASGWG